MLYNTIYPIIQQFFVSNGMQQEQNEKPPQTFSDLINQLDSLQKSFNSFNRNHKSGDNNGNELQM